MITVLGASGFIGSHLVARLKESGVEHYAPGRHEQLSNRDLGDVIFCIGLTADFRSRPFETVDAHVNKLLEFLRDTQFNSLLYISSTRVYEYGAAIAREEDPLEIAPLNPSNVYNISKAMGESLAFACGKKVRVVRLSNVYGNDFTSENFLPSIIKDAILARKVVLRTSPDSEKDYISISDTVDALIKIATSGCHEIYNVASGVNVSHQQLLDRIRRLTGCEVEFDPEAPRISFPSISIERIRREFDFQPASLLEDLDKLVDSYRKHFASQPVTNHAPNHHEQESRASHVAKPKKVLLTATSRLIVLHCIPLLEAKGYEVHAVSSKATDVEGSAGLTWHKVDLLDPNQVKNLVAHVEPSHLLHLAWYAVPGKYWRSTENLRWVQASLNLAQAFADHRGQRFVAAGSCAEYQWGDSEPCSETTSPLRPATLYGASKHALSIMLDSYARLADFSYAWGRIFFLYGPRESETRLVSSVVRSLLRGEPVLCSYGGQVRDFLYVEDVASAFVTLLESDISGAINIGSGKPVKLIDILDEIGNQLNRRDLIRLGTIAAGADEPAVLVANTGRLTCEVNWQPSYSLNVGIEKTIDWWRNK